MAKDPEKAAPFIDYTELTSDGDQWEAFTRDFLVDEGFTIDSPPNRGADGGKDLIVTENLKGLAGRYLFRWLVSCKHNASSGKAVSEQDEPNVLERVRSHACDGFIGVYRETQPAVVPGHRATPLPFDRPGREAHAMPVGVRSTTRR